MKTDHWPKLEYQTPEGAIETIGQIQPFPFPACDERFPDYELCGLPVKLRGRYGDVSGILAASREDATKLFEALGPR